MTRPQRDLDGSQTTVVYRGTRLGSVALAHIQEVIEGHQSCSHRFIAELVCEHFGWRRPNGELAGSSCAVFLERLSAGGLLQLPVRRQKRRSSHPDKDLEALLEALGPVPGSVECPPEGPLEVRPIAVEEWDGFRLHLRRYHYLGFTKPAGESLCYIALIGGELVALLVWGAAALRNGPRDRWLGWEDGTRERHLPWVTNNSRFLVLPWIRLPHLASRILGANLRRLSRDWRATYGHAVLLAETFVDTARFRGTCYRASNWLAVGRTQGFSRSRAAPKGFVHHGRPKAVFLYPLHRRAAQLLRSDPTATSRAPSAWQAPARRNPLGGAAEAG